MPVNVMLGTHNSVLSNVKQDVRLGYVCNRVNPSVFAGKDPAF